MSYSRNYTGLHNFARNANYSMVRHRRRSGGSGSYKDPGITFFNYLGVVNKYARPGVGFGVGCFNTTVLTGVTYVEVALYYAKTFNKFGTSVNLTRLALIDATSLTGWHGVSNTPYSFWFTTETGLEPGDHVFFAIGHGGTNQFISDRANGWDSSIEMLTISGKPSDYTTCTPTRTDLPGYEQWIYWPG